MAKNTLNSWLDEPHVSYPSLSNGMYLMWYSHGDLRYAYDIKTDAGLEGFILWMVFVAHTKPYQYLPTLSKKALGLIIESLDGLSVLERHVLDSRNDLKAEFYANGNIDEDRYQSWFAERFRIEYPTAYEYINLSIANNDLTDTKNSVRSHGFCREFFKVTDAAGRNVINIVGYFRAQLGIGEDARMLRKALMHGDYEIINVVDISESSFSPLGETSYEALATDTLFLGGTTIFCTTAYDQLRLIFTFGPDFFDENYCIGYWPWELSSWPEGWSPVFRLVDRVWASSSFLEKIYQKISPVPVVKVPLAVGYDLAPVEDRSVFGFNPGDFVFLFIFDGLSYMDRKNPIFHVRAFKKAFGSDESVRLVIKTMNGQHTNQKLWIDLISEIGSDERITILNEVYSKDKLLSLLGAVDAYISFHRSEGFGRTLAEAMLFGKPVIASNYSGNLEFCTNENSFLVSGELISVEEGQYPFHENQYWFEPSLKDAVEKMRLVWLNPDLRQGKAARGFSEIENFSPNKIYERYIKTECPGNFDISTLQKFELLDLDSYKSKYAISGSEQDVIRFYIRNAKIGKVGISKYFDEKFYAETYTDVAKFGCNELVHYLQAGWSEKRCANKYFDSRYYTELYTDIVAAKAHPLVHYVYQGWREKRIPFEGFDYDIFGTVEGFNRNECPLNLMVKKNPDKSIYSKRRYRFDFSVKSEVEVQRSIPCVDIIIPVYNGLGCLRKLIDSIFYGTSEQVRLLIVDDASTDPDVKPYLRSLELERENVFVIYQATNRGFSASVNLAYEQVKSSVFVVLNSDAVVPGNWLARLISPILEDGRISSVTPFSNSATICSFPFQNKDNDLIDGRSLDFIDKAFAEIKPRNGHVKIPTGVGFCMAINKSVIEDIGFLDEEAFGRGYGEENDWCMRAYLAGYKNVIALNLFVYHSGTSSFEQSEKLDLLEKNLAKLKFRYPFYEKWVVDFETKDPLRIYRYEALINLIKASRECFLLVDHSASGGTNLYSNRVLESMILEGKRPVIKLAHDLASSVFYGVVFYKSIQIPIELNFYDFESFLAACGCKDIYLNSLVFNSEYKKIIEACIAYKEKHGASLVYLLHDYYAICPSFILLDSNDEFCDVPDLVRCRSCIPVNKNNAYNLSLDDLDIDGWREIWGRLLINSNEIIAFSSASERLLLKAYPSLVGRVVVKPHHVDKPVDFYALPHPADELRVAFVGGISRHKGADIVIEIDELNRKNNLGLKLYVIGTLQDPDAKFQGTVTGPYVRDELLARLRDCKIDLVFLPFVWPETFSYLTQELINYGCHIGTFDIGAPGERVSHYPNGFVVKEISASAALEAIEIYGSKLKGVGCE